MSFNNNNVKIDITDLKYTEKKVKEHKDVIDNSVEYKTVFDKNIPIEEKIRFYIKKEFSEDIDLDTIRECINLKYENQ